MSTVIKCQQSSNVNSHQMSTVIKCQLSSNVNCHQIDGNDLCTSPNLSQYKKSTGRQESEHLLGTIVGQYRRLISTCAVRAQAMCILARVGIITPAAREAARRRQVAMRLEGQMREERKAQWMEELFTRFTRCPSPKFLQDPFRKVTKLSLFSCFEINANMSLSSWLFSLLLNLLWSLLSHRW